MQLIPSPASSETKWQKYYLTSAGPWVSEIPLKLLRSDLGPKQLNKSSSLGWFKESLFSKIILRSLEAVETIFLIYFELERDGSEAGKKYKEFFSEKLSYWLSIPKSPIFSEFT